MRKAHSLKGKGRKTWKPHFVVEFRLFLSAKYFLNSSKSVKDKKRYRNLKKPETEMELENRSGSWVMFLQLYNKATHDDRRYWLVYDVHKWFHQWYWIFVFWGEFLCMWGVFFIAAQGWLLKVKKTMKIPHSASVRLWIHFAEAAVQ